MAETYTIRPLVWVRTRQPSRYVGEQWEAETLFGLCFACEANASPAAYATADEWGWKPAVSIVDAKRLAEAAYRERLLTALERAT